MSRQQSSASSPRGDTTKGRPLIKCFVVGESSSDAYLFDLLRKYSKPSRAVTVGAGGSAHQSPAMTDEDEASALPTTLTITVMGQKSNDGNQCSPLTKATASEVSGYDLGGVDVAFHRNGSREMRYGCAKEAGSVVLAMTPFGDQQYEEYKTASHMCDLLFESCGSMGGGGSPILVNFGEKQPVFTCDVPGNSYPINVTLLGLAVGIQAGYVFKSLSEPSEETITKLIDAIVLTSQSYRLVSSGIDFSRECMITSSLFLEEEEATFPQEGLIGVSKMSCSHVRSLLHLLSSNFKTNATEHAYCELLRLWAGAGNWPAVDELVFSNHLVKAEVDMWNTVIPHQFEGLACQVLRCLRPENNGIPEWKLRSRVGAVFFRENQPTYLVRKSDTPPQWPFIKLFLLFGEEPMPSEPTHQIVALGGPHLHRAALLKCLMENKAKATVRLTKLPTTTAPVVQVHTPFQLSNKQWTAWDLGGGTQEEWNPFYPCFFFSDSVFLLVFDASASSSTISAHHPELPKLHFLLNQISSCHHHKKKASCYRPHSQKPKVVLVGIQTSNPLDPDAPSSLNDLYQTARKHWEKNIDFLDFYTVNLESGESLHLRDSSSVLERMVKCLQRNTTRPYVVPQTWARLRSSLGGINNKGALKWLQLVRLAHSCGVGRTTSQISQAAQRDEIRLCFDWLSDIGSIFHFRHRYFQESSSQRGYNDGLVVLDPSWFNSLYNLTLSMNKEITNPTSVPSHTPPKAVDPSVAESLESLMQRFTTKKMADHLGPAERVVLSKLGLLMTTTSPKNPEFFPFFVLPSTPPGSVGDQLLGLSGFRENGTVSGCVLQFEFLPSESFTAVMRELCFIPGVHILMCWRDGILLSKYTTVPQKRSSDVKELEVQGEARLLMTRHNQAASVGGAPHTRVEVTITAVPPFGFKILATALDFLSKITGVMVVQHSFICPMCFLMHLKSSGGFQMPTAAESEFKNYFTMTQMTEAAGRDPSTLECEKHGSLEVDDIAPGLLLHTFTHDSEGAGSSELSSNTSTNCCAHGNNRKGLLNTLQEVALLQISPFPHTITPLDPNQPFTLSDVLKACLVSGQPGLLDKMLPMPLRKKILRDVAQGLRHLHSQIPPVFHGDIRIGTVLITSLDVRGSVICAKITDPKVTAHSPSGSGQPTTTTRSKSTVMSPEAINLQREEQDPPEYTDNTKTDVWNFGILVHNVVAPLSLVEIRSTSSLRISSRLCTSTWTPSPPPKAAIVEQQAPEFSLLTILRGLTAKTANRSSSGSSGTTISSPTWTPGPDDSGQSTYSIGSKARRRHVERHLVGYALASGTYVVDFPPTRRKSKRPRRDPSSSFPQWARQLVTLCLAAEPLRRPSMNDLLIVLSYFED